MELLIKGEKGEKEGTLVPFICMYSPNQNHSKQVGNQQSCEALLIKKVKKLFLTLITALDQMISLCGVI